MQPKWSVLQCNLFYRSRFDLGDAVIAVWLVQKLSWTWNRVCFYFTLRTLFQIRPIYNISKLLQPELFFVIYKYLCKMLWYFRNICWSRLDKWTNRIWSRCWYRIDVQQTRVFRSVRAWGPRTGPWRTCVFSLWMWHHAGRPTTDNCTGDENIR